MRNSVSAKLMAKGGYDAEFRVHNIRRRHKRGELYFAFNTEVIGIFYRRNQIGINNFERPERQGLRVGGAVSRADFLEAV